MARIRTIKPGFFRDGDLYDMEAETGLPLRVAYAGLWTVADREGLFKWKPREIKTEVLPYDNVNMNDVMDALVKCGKVLKYEIDGQEYGWIISFLVHQHVNKHEAKSTIPKPPAKKNARASTRRSPSGKEGKGKEGDIADADASFEAFWKVCPKKTGRGAAEKAWAKAIELASPETITAAMARYAETQVGKDPAYIKTPGPWLNEKRWTDEGVSMPEAFQNTDERGWRGRLAGFRDKALWTPKWGPKPGEAGCKCPPHILDDGKEAA